MRKYPELTDMGKEYIELIKKWSNETSMSLNRLIEDYEKLLRLLPFNEFHLRRILFALGGEIVIPKSIIDDFELNLDRNLHVNVNASPLEDGSWRIWTVSESEDNE